MDMWQKSGLSVRAFCKEHGLVETTFYAWRRELIIRAREVGGIEDSQAAPTTPNMVKDSRGRTIRVCFRNTDRDVLPTVLEQGSPAENPFVPLSIVPDGPGTAEKKATSAVNAGITITTPSGYRISLASTDDLGLFERTLHILEDHAKC